MPVSLFSCKDTVRLLSQSLDRGLSLGQRLVVRLHLLLCPMCSRFRRQLLFLHRAAGTFEEKRRHDVETSALTLSPEAKERMERALEDEDLGMQG
jgi:hypothetical protein